MTPCALVPSRVLKPGSCGVWFRQGRGKLDGGRGWRGDPNRRPPMVQAWRGQPGQGTAERQATDRSIHRLVMGSILCAWICTTQQRSRFSLSIFALQIPVLRDGKHLVKVTRAESHAAQAYTVHCRHTMPPSTGAERGSLPSRSGEAPGPPQPLGHLQGLSWSPGEDPGTWLHTQARAR